MRRALIAAALTLAAAPAAALPAPKVDAPAKGLQTAVLAGGCFWGMEAVFEHVKGVRTVVSGYAGGSAANARYEKVSGEGTGHAEAVKIVYDPARISYGQLLQIYFGAAHDPTQVNRQGPDVGPSYRSAIFPQNAVQKRVAAAYIAQLRTAFPRPIATRIESGAFYPAEAYHQDFARKNPRHPYIVHWDEPKLAGLKKAFPTWWRS
ncbi:MAG: peptide-methionine (S)-S-oxide reductase MsrA [Alphaproteobacteria bacterium]|nr:MAG: peptide-methionine (S)-S-oxide reductase MsrA [Alphaproteobacteria bacterium]